MPGGQLGEPAREARQLVTEALLALPSGSQCAACLRAASAELENVEQRVADSDETGPPSGTGVLGAVSLLGEALSELTTESPSAEHSEAVETVARALALLYPVARAQQRQRQELVLNPSQAPHARESLPPLSHIPRAPRAPRAAPVPFTGAERREPERVLVETELGLLSDSNFFTGTSRDLSRGGLFVATYQPRPQGTEVELYFVLPTGQRIRATGVVRWSRGSGSNEPPGMGVAFVDIGKQDLEAIKRFCKVRAPLVVRSLD